MAASQQLASLGSDGDPRYAMYDDKKKKRMISNRESARRSRMKKQQHLDELTSQVNLLKNENNRIAEKINAITPMYHAIDSENKVLGAQVFELTERLQSLNAILQVAQEASGLMLDTPELVETPLEPWQFPYPMQPITASAAMFYH